MYVSILKVKRRDFKEVRYFVVDKKGTLSTSEVDAMIFPNEEMAINVSGKLEWLYESQSKTDNIIASCDAEKINMDEFLRFGGK